MSEFSLPGVPNIHSHAFQRVMAGLAERLSDPADSFWTWRELMYRFAGRLTPQSQYDIAAQLFVEMLEAGYTSVCEFHYLHHQPNGRPYAEPSAMSRALIDAARDTGIRLTLLPVLYMTGGFDGRALSERQRRFGHDVDSYLSLVESLYGEENETLRIGVALHSLRAVPERALREMFESAFFRENADMPIHLHIAEQIAEVDECLAVRGARPVEWLLANAPVDERWTLVHATHLSETEVRGIADANAVVALCPSTEANLGDGLFPLRAFLDADGRFGIGSDSNVSISPIEELRWLEYGQRLAARRRNIAASTERPSVGRNLFELAVEGGLQSCGQGDRVRDRVVLDQSAPALTGAKPEDLHDRLVFAGDSRLIKEVFVAGKKLVADGRHVKRDSIASGYRTAMRGLLADG